MAKKKLSELYGFVGWREFLSARDEILHEVDRSKSKNISRPVRTSHGNAAEAKIRQWLSEFLPEKYGITSGFIISPDVVPDYKLSHFDVIIYDKLSAPVLWLDADQDMSNMGAHRAIPAKHVLGIIECKASFTKTTIESSIEKLSKVKSLMGPHAESVFTSIIFVDVHEAQLNDYDALSALHPAIDLPRFLGGMILRCQANQHISGRLYFGDLDDLRGVVAGQRDAEHTVPDDFAIKAKIPLYFDVDNHYCKWSHENRKDGVFVLESSGVEFMTWNDPSTGEPAINVLKIHRTAHGSKGEWIILDWSYDMFAANAVNILAALDSDYADYTKNVPIGRVFHRLERLSKEGSFAIPPIFLSIVGMQIHSFAKQEFTSNKELRKK